MAAVKVCYTGLNIVLFFSFGERNPIPRMFRDSNKKTFSIVLVMSHESASHTPWHDTYVGFCQYNEDEDGGQCYL